jgi:hypothetical protein
MSRSAKSVANLCRRAVGALGQRTAVAAPINATVRPTRGFWDGAELRKLGVAVLQPPTAVVKPYPPPSAFGGILAHQVALQQPGPPPTQ